jgi:hypothetical protein
MKYMLLIYQDPAFARADGTPEADARRQEWFTYDAGLRDDGSRVEGAALQGVEQATTVRVRDGRELITDGPFAETKEFLAGYYVVDVPDLDAALERAKRMPNVGDGAVEVRPVWEIPGL